MSFIPKFDILETKFSMYEELSRNMMEKLEVAVDKLSDSNAMISAILSKHDEKIEQGLKNDAQVYKVIGELKDDNQRDHESVRGKILKLENKLDELIKFRWIAMGVVLIVGFLVAEGALLNNILTPRPEPVRMEQPK
jgi:hypothetical protein